MGRIIFWLGVAGIAALPLLAACDDGGGAGDTCESHDDCGDTDICLVTECVAAFGREYRLTLAAASLPDESSSGDAWDFPNGLPDGYLVLVDGRGWECESDAINDSLTPAWHFACEPRTIEETTELEWSVYDFDDEADDELIAGAPLGLSLERIRQSEFNLTSSGATVYFVVEAVE